IDPAHAAGCWQTDGSADNDHFRARLAGRLGNRETHFAGAAITDETNGIDPLTGRTGGNQHAPAAKRTVGSQLDARAINEIEGLQHAAGTHLTTRLIALAGSKHLDP